MATRDDLGELLLLGALQGTTLEVRSRVAPPVVLDLASLVGGGPPGPLTQLIQPTITLRRGDEVLLMSSPAGEASSDAWLVGLVVSSLVVLLVVVLVASAD
jgi:hypothetical protein